MSLERPNTEALLQRAASGDTTAREQLLSRHRDRLRRMVAVRLDRRLSARIDPSDVVQEALADAAVQLDDYVDRRPLPLYSWLRQFALRRLVDMHRHHLHAHRRSVARERHHDLPLPDRSAIALVDRLIGSGTSPSGRLIRIEHRIRLREALEGLPIRDREVLVMRYLEQLSSAEIASVLGIGEGAVKMRLLRAAERLRNRMDDPDEG
jgi:RNA polymerase sigma-70 factor (ECF subfamily)